MADNLLNINDYSNDSLLPPNTQGNNVSNLVDAATIGAYNPNGQNVPSSDVSYIQNQMDPLNGQNPAIKDATNEMFMPGLHEPLRVGGTSGQMTGSRDIFVGGGAYVPFAALERRKQAQQDAAIKRAADLKSFKLQKPKLSKDPRFNRNLVSTANDFTNIFIGEAEKQYGSREAAMKALTDPTTKIGREFIQQMDNLEILAGEVDQVVDASAKIDKAIETGDQYISPITRQRNQEFKKLLGSFEGGNAFGAASFRDKLNELQTSIGLDAYIKDQAILSNIDAVILQTAGVSDSADGESYRTSTRYTEDFSKAAKAQAKSMAPNFPQMTEDEIYNHLLTLKGSVDKKTAGVVNKPKDSDGGYKKKEDIIVTKDPKILDVNGGQMKTTISVPHSNTAKQQPLKIDGALIYGPDGKKTTQKGIIEFIPVSNHLLDNGDRVMSGKQAIRTANLSEDELLELGFSGGIKKVPEIIYKDILLDYDNVEKPVSSQGKTFDLANQAFNDAAPKVVLTKVLIDKDNVSTDFKRDFIDSEFETVDEYINDQKKKGKNIILNESSQKEINSIDFNKEVKRQRALKQKRVSNRKYTPEQESLIDQNMKANPGYSREEIIKALEL